MFYTLAPEGITYNAELADGALASWESSDTGTVSIDTDGDGLSDAAEEVLGTDPASADTDGDGLNDLEELIQGTDPLVEDSDDDGATDSEEIDAGTDPLDSSDVPGSTPGINEWVTCAAPTDSEDAEVKANHFGSRDYYVEGDYGDHEGNECVCTVSLSGTSAIDGITVRIPTAVHDNSDWESDPRPKAVAVYLPWKEDSATSDDGIRYAWDTDSRTETEIDYDLLESTDTTSIPFWFAFDDNVSLSDSAFDAVSSTAIDFSGEYTIWVSKVNIDGEKIEDCNRLFGDSNTSGYEGYLQLRVDYATALTAPPRGPAKNTNGILEGTGQSSPLPADSSAAH